MSDKTDIQQLNEVLKTIVEAFILEHPKPTYDDLFMLVLAAAHKGWDLREGQGVLERLEQINRDFELREWNERKTILDLDITQ